MVYLCQQDVASFASEVKALRKWEFNGFNPALGCITTWFSGTESESQTLQSNLVLLHEKVPFLSFVHAKLLLLLKNCCLIMHLKRSYFQKLYSLMLENAQLTQMIYLQGLSGGRNTWEQRTKQGNEWQHWVYGMQGQLSTVYFQLC